MVKVQKVTVQKLRKDKVSSTPILSAQYLPPHFSPPECSVRDLVTHFSNLSMCTPLHVPHARLLTHPVIGEWSYNMSDPSLKQTSEPITHVNDTAQTLEQSSDSMASAPVLNIGHIGRCSERLRCREGSCTYIACKKIICPTSRRLMNAESWTSWWSEQ